MESITDLQNALPQEQAQINPPLGYVTSATIAEQTSTPPPPLAINIEARREHNGELRALSKTYGHIPNIPIFTQWDKRVDCSNSAVHRSVMAGICGNRKDGAYSVALSSLYKDDEDGGDVIIYTGAGGRERWTNTSPPRRLRIGPQTKDQSWEDTPNKALIVSFLTGHPVRVLRSWRCPSKYAPLNGYRYDGLYKVAAYWTAKGYNGKNICRCRLERLPDQPPIPLRPITMSTSSRRRRDRLVSGLPSSSSPSTNPYDTSANGTDVDMDVWPNQPNVSPAQLARSAGGESEGLPNPPQREMSETSTGVDFNMGELEPDVKYLQPLSPQRGIPSKPSTLPRYRWDPMKHELVKIRTSNTISEDFDAAEEGEEANRVEDDATLVPSEDGHMPVNERMEM